MGQRNWVGNERPRLNKSEFTAFVSVYAIAGCKILSPRIFVPEYIAVRNSGTLLIIAQEDQDLVTAKNYSFRRERHSAGYA